MDERELDKAIWWAAIAIVGYHVIGIVIPLLTKAVVIILAWRVIRLFLRNR